MRVSRGIKRAVAIAAAGAVLLSAMPAVAQEWENLRTKLLDKANELMAAQGFHAVGFFHDGSLNDDGNEIAVLPLGGGDEIMLVGICDGDCSDLDMTLYDPNGNVVGSDMQTDDVPIVRTTPNRTGNYTVSISMAACSINPCRYAVQTFVK